MDARRCALRPAGMKGNPVRPLGRWNSIQPRAPAQAAERNLDGTRGSYKFELNDGDSSRAMSFEHSTLSVRPRPAGTAGPILHLWRHNAADEQVDPGLETGMAKR